MENKLDYQKLVMQYSIDTNKEATDELKQDFDYIKKKLNKYDLEFSKIKALLNKVLGQNQNYSPDRMDSPKYQDPTTVVMANNKSPPLEVGNSIKIGGMWNLKHQIS